jgi:putative membrane protein (TIGR04086 family)
VTAMAIFAQVRWGRVLLAGFFAELLVFVVVFPALWVFGEAAFLAAILVASTLMPFIGAIWVGRRISSRFALHGTLVGLVAALIYIGLAWGQPQPFLYKVAHVLKLCGGLAGGAVAARRHASRVLAV